MSPHRAGAVLCAVAATLATAANAQAQIKDFFPSLTEVAVYYAPIFTGAANANWSSRLDQFGVEGLFTVASVGSTESCKKSASRKSTLDEISKQMDTARIQMELARAELAGSYGIAVNDENLQLEQYVDIDHNLQVTVNDTGRDERKTSCAAQDVRFVRLCEARQKLQDLAAAQRVVERESTRRMSKCANWTVEIGIGYSQTSGLTRDDFIFSYKAATSVPAYGTVRQIPSFSVYLDRNFEQFTVYAGASMAIVQLNATSYTENGSSLFNRVALAASGDAFGYGVHGGIAFAVAPSLNLFVQLSHESQVFSGVKYTLTGTAPGESAGTPGTGLPQYAVPNLSLSYTAAAAGVQFHFRD